jgi:hypothetical protein
VISQTGNHPTKDLAKFGYWNRYENRKIITNPFMFWLPVETCCKKSGNSKTNKIWQRGSGGGISFKINPLYV